MADRENREDWKRERSLLALGQAVRGEDESEASLVSIGDRADRSWREDAATRHRLARSQREARTKPTQSAAVETGQLRSDEQRQAAARDDAWRSQDNAGIGDPPPAVPHARAAAEDPSVNVRSHDSGLRQEANASFGDRGDGQQWKPLIDPMQVVRGVARSRLLIITTTILGAGLGIAIALSTPKKYESMTELTVDPRDLKLSDRDLTQMAVVPDATLVNVENQIRLLTSGTVLSKVVKQLNLVDDPEFNGQGTGGLGVMSLIRSILLRHDGPGGVDGSRRQSLAIGNLAESLSVERAGKTSTITIGVITQNAQKSALIAETMTDVFLATSGEMQSSTAGRATNELTAKLEEMRKSVETAERKVEDFRATHDLVDAQGHLISDDQMLKVNEQLSVARARTAELNARAASARSINVNSVLGGTLPEEINSNTMSDLRSQYAALKQEADRAAVRLGPRHPELQALDAQLAGARDRIAAELSRIASSLQVDLKRSVQVQQDLASQLAQMKVRSGDVNSDLVSMRELERDATAKRSVYEQYLLRAKEIGEQKGINTANMTVISPPSVPLEPNGPSRIVVALAGLLLGFASGVGLGAMRGAYESLRETATSRSRRDSRMDERETAYEDRAYQAAPPPASGRPVPPPPAPTPPAPQPPAPPPLAAAPPPVPQAEITPAENPGRIGALLSMLRNAMSRKPAPEESVDDGEWVSPIAESGQPVAAAYPQPPFQHDAHVLYPQQMTQPPLPPRMAPQPQPYPYAQPMGYPQVQPWQMQSQPGYPYPQPIPAPYGQMPYPSQPAASAHPQPSAPQQQAAQPSAPSGEVSPDAEDIEQQASIEEIRASLREFREAVQELTESRARRRYF